MAPSTNFYPLSFGRGYFYVIATFVRIIKYLVSDPPTTLITEVRKVGVKVPGGRAFEGTFLEGAPLSGEKGKPEAYASGFPAFIKTKV